MRDSHFLHEPQKFKVKLSFHQVRLAVKFTCHISLALKEQPTKSTSPKPLMNGRSDLATELSFEWETQYDSFKEEYRNSLIEINVLVHSAKGIIEGGICLIDATKSFEKLAVPLKKCCDKSAILIVTCSSERQQEKAAQTAGKSFNATPFQSRRVSKERSMIRIRSEEHLMPTCSYNQSLLSVSKISISSNPRLEKFYRNESDQLLKENDMLKERIKSYQRKEKELFQQLKENRSKYQKLNNRCTEVEGLNELNQMLLIEKDRYIKNYQSQNARLEDAMNNYFQEVKMLTKKLEAKDQGVTDREEQIVSKIQNLQRELESTTKAHLALLGKYEQVSKANLIANSEKDRVFQIQRSNLLSQLSSKEFEIKKLILEKDLQNSKPQIQQIVEKQSDMVMNSKLIQEQKEIISQLTDELMRVRKAKGEIEGELMEQRVKEEDRLALKKKINEVQLSNRCIQMEHKKAVQSLNLSESKVEVLLNLQERLQAEKKNIAVEMQAIKKQLILKSAQCKELKQERDELAISYRQLAELLKAKKWQEESKKSSFKQYEQQISLKFQNSTAQRSRLEEENRELRQIKIAFAKAEKQNSSIIMDLNNENQRLSCELVSWEERLEQLQLENAELVERVVQLEIDNDSKRMKIKQLNQELKQVSSVLTTEQQMVVKSNLEHSKQCQFLESAIRVAKEQNIDLQHQIETVLEEVSCYKRKEQSQQLLIREKDQNQKILKKKIFLFETEVGGLRDQNSVLKLQLIGLSQQILNKDEQLQSFTKKLQQSQHEKQAIKRQIAELGEYTSAIERQLETFQILMEKILQKLINLLGDEQIQEEVLEQINFPNENLKQMLRDVITSRQEKLADSRKTSSFLREEKEFIEQELVKISNQLFQSQAEFEQTLEKERKAASKKEKEFLREKKQLLTNLAELENARVTLKASSDNYFRQIKGLEHNIQELELEINNFKQTNQELEEKLAQQQRQVVEISQKYESILRMAQMKNQQGHSQRESAWSIEKERLLIDLQILKKIGCKREEELLSCNERNKQLQQKWLGVQIENKKLSFDLSVQRHVNEELQEKYVLVCQSKKKIDLLVSELKVELEDREKKVSHKQIALCESSAKCIQQESKLSLIVEDNSKKEQLLKNIRKELALKEEEISGLQSARKQSQNAHEKQIKSAQEQINKLDRDVSIFKLLLKQAEENIENLQSAKHRLEAELDQKREALRLLEEDSEHMRKQLLQQESHQDFFIQESEMMSLNYENAKSQICILEEEKSVLSSEVEKLKGELLLKTRTFQENLKSEKINIQREVSLMVQEKNQQEAKFKALQNTFLELRGEYIEMRLQLQQRERDLFAERQEKQRLMDDYEQHLNQLSQALERLQERNEELSNEHGMETAQLLKQMEALQMECNELIDQLAEKQQKQEQKNRTVEELNYKLKEVQSELIRFQTESPRSSEQN